MLSWSVSFNNHYDKKPTKLTEEAERQLAFYRPLHAGITTPEEMEHMTTDELVVLNEVALQLEHEQANMIANEVARRFSSDE